MLENPWHQSKLGLRVHEQLEFSRAARERFFPFVFDAPIYDGHDIMAGKQKKPTDYDERHHFFWSSREQLLGISLICNREYLDNQFVEENQEFLHVSMSLFAGNNQLKPIHTSTVAIPAAIEVPILLVPKITWSLKMRSEKVFHFHANVDDVRQEIARRTRQKT